jgi:hypothetical protein
MHNAGLEFPNKFSAICPSKLSLARHLVPDPFALVFRAVSPKINSKSFF